VEAAAEDPVGGGEEGFFFCLIILAFDLSGSWRRTFCLVFLSGVRAVVAHCKLPFAPPPHVFRKEESPPTIDLAKNLLKTFPELRPSASLAEELIRPSSVFDHNLPRPPPPL